jgi:polyhydroxybutyrate depolymerase
MTVGPYPGKGRLAPAVTAFTAALAALAALGAAGPPAAGAATTTPACSRPSPAGLRTIALTDQGRSRPFALYVPATYDGHKRIPVLLNLHGSGGNGAGQMGYSQLWPVADAAGYAVVAPDGGVKVSDTGFSWNVPGVPLTSGPVPPGSPDDERYLLAVVKQVARTLCTLPSRVFLTGMSGGARMTSQLACDHASSFAAIAPVAGLRAGVPQQLGGAWSPTPRTCRPARPTPVLTFHGTADQTNPFAGNNDPRWGYSTDAALARWAHLDHCAAGPQTTTVTQLTARIRFSRCRSGTTVTLYRTTGGAHSWPGSTDTTPGATDPGIDANRLMISFFSSVRTPRPRR